MFFLDYIIGYVKAVYTPDMKTKGDCTLGLLQMFRDVDTHREKDKQWKTFAEITNKANPLYSLVYQNPESMLGKIVNK